MKKLIFLIFNLLIPTITLPNFNLSPWIIINNKSNLDFTCEIKAACYQDDYEDDNITLMLNNNEELNFKCEHSYDEDGNDLIVFIIRLDCKAEQTTVLNPIFYHDDIMFNPPIKSIKIVHDSLQLTASCDSTSTNKLYFTIEHQSDRGITVQKQTISTYIRCLNNFKQTIRNTILAALNATNYLPY